MRIDLYTKTVLTVIAACLVWMSLGGPSLLTPVSAQAPTTSGYQRVLVAGWVDNTGREIKLDYGVPVAVQSMPR
jgi:hypothetical protein